MRQIGPFLCWKLFAGGYWAGLSQFLGQIIPFFNATAIYLHFFGFLLTSPTSKYHPHILSYLWVTLDFWLDDVWPLGRLFLAKITLFGAKICVILA